MIELITDPLKFQQLLWPHVHFYDKQLDVINSIVDNDVTVVPAGNMLGKDFIAGFIAVWFFVSRFPCRIVTTSAKDDHLRVLWGEINRFIQTSSIPLDHKNGGPLVLNHQDIRRVRRDGSRCPISYIKGMVASSDSIAAMQGHHVANIGDGIPRTLFISDESSSVPDEYWTMASTWCNRALILGNTWTCTNFFYRAVKGNPEMKDPGGDLFSKDNKRCYRKVIRIRAEDSPNVRLAVAEREKGKEPSNRVLIPGVKSYPEYIKNRETWDQIQQCVSLDADFYEGAELKLFPMEWLVRASKMSHLSRGPKYLGVDTGEGGDDTAWSVIDEGGILHQEAMKTPDTSMIPKYTLLLMQQYGVQAKNTLFDRGGGGYEHVCQLRSQGHQVRSVGFGESASDPNIKRRMRTVDERMKTTEQRYVYKNRRAEMYCMLRLLLDPRVNPGGFSIDAKYIELRRQLKPIPLLFDEEGRIYLPPKDGPADVTLKKMIGCSPDEADSLVLAVFGMQRKSGQIIAGGSTFRRE